VQSQKYNTPVFALADEQIEQVGIILETMETSRDNLQKSFDTLANSVKIITGMAPKKKGVLLPPKRTAQ
jgi:chromosome partitioning protein